MTNEPDDDAAVRQALGAFDRDLEALLRVEPSADFMAGVRARIAQTRPARSAWWLLAPAMATGLVALLLVRAGLRAAPTPAPLPRAVAAASPRPVPVVTSENVRPTPAPRAAAPRPRRAPAQPEVIVPPGEERALLAFVAANARAVRGLQVTASTSADESMAPPAPIDIAPLETAPLADPAGHFSRSDS